MQYIQYSTVVLTVCPWSVLLLQYPHISENHSWERIIASDLAINPSSRLSAMHMGQCFRVGFNLISYLLCL